MAHPDIAELMKVAGGEEDPEVEAHLEACPTCRELLQLCGGALPELSPRPEPVPVPDHLVVPRDQYERGEELHRGGMGRVTVATDRRLGRRVLLKELLHGGSRAARERMGRRLRQEAELAAGLDHPGIVAVHEAGYWEDGEPFLAMALVRGETLTDALEGRRELAARIGLVASVTAAADAIAFAHERAVVHRDLKPDNLLLGPFGEMVVIDWGLAKRLGEAGESGEGGESGEAGEREAAQVEGDGALTQLGVGTPAYMPPEQARGESPTPAFDVYALGATLYHVLAGAPPYADEPPTRVRTAVMAGPPLPLRELAPLAPPELVALVERAMAREPADRFPDGAALARELHRFIDGQLLESHTYRPRELLWRWIRRNRAVVATAAVGVVLLAGLGIWAARGLTLARDRAEAGEAQAELELRRARGTAALRLAEDPTTRVEALQASVLAVAPSFLDGAPALDEARAGLMAAVSSGAPAHRIDGRPALLTTRQVGDERIVVAGFQAPELRRWRFGATGTVTDRMELPLPDLRGLVLGPRGSRAVAMAMDQSLLFVDLDARTTVPLEGLPEHGAQLLQAGLTDASVAVLEAAGAVRAWDLHGQSLPRLELPERIAILESGPTQDTVALGTVDGTVALWRPGDPAPVELGRHDSEVAILQAERGRLRSVSRSGQIWTWVVDGSGQATRHEDQSRIVDAVRASRSSAGGQRHAVVSAGGRLVIGDDAARTVLSIPAAGPYLGLQPFSPDGRFFARQLPDGSVEVLDLEADAGVVAHLLSDGSRVLGLVVLPDASILVARGSGLVRWDARASLVAGNLPPHGAEVVDLAATPAGGFVSVSTDGRAVRWDPAQDRVTELVRAIGPLCCVEVRAGVVAIAGVDGQVWIEHGEGLRRLPHPDVLITDMVITSKGQVVTASGDGRVRVLSDGQDAPRVIDAGGPVAGIDARAGTLFVATVAGEVLQIGGTATKADLELDASGVAPLRGLLALPEGVLVSGQRESLWFGPTEPLRWRGHVPGAARHATAPPGGVLLADERGALSVRDLPAATRRWRRDAHAHAVTRAVMVGDEVVSVGIDGLARRWGRTDGTPRGQLRYRVPVTAVAGSDDAQRLMLGLEDGGLRLVVLDPGVAIETACQRLRFLDALGPVAESCARLEPISPGE